MGVLPDKIQEAICGSHLSEQYEMRVSYYEAKIDECDRILEGIHL